jgi:hypothetical protein
MRRSSLRPCKSVRRSDDDGIKWVSVAEETNADGMEDV